MKRSVCLLILLFALSQVLLAQGKHLNSFIPRDYDTLSVVEGDLNKDGLNDVVLALYHKMEKIDPEKVNQDSIPPRLLVILFNTQSGYKQAASSASALLCKYCGGVFGDPFAGITIERNVLTISHYGGSAWKWALDHKFRFQNNNWFLIGQTKNSFWSVEQCEKLGDFAGTDYEDINFVTGSFERKRISQDCKLLENKKGKRKVEPLVTLDKFIIDN